MQSFQPNPFYIFSIRIEGVWLSQVLRESTSFFHPLEDMIITFENLSKATWIWRYSLQKNKRSDLYAIGSFSQEWPIVCVTPAYSVLCVPSQNGGVFVFLH